MWEARGNGQGNACPRISLSTVSSNTGSTRAAGPSLFQYLFQPVLMGRGHAIAPPLITRQNATAKGVYNGCCFQYALHDVRRSSSTFRAATSAINNLILDEAIVEDNVRICRSCTHSNPRRYVSGLDMGLFLFTLTRKSLYHRSKDMQILRPMS